MERPRDRLKRLGPSALSVAELVALVLGAGARRKAGTRGERPWARIGLRDLAGRDLSRLDLGLGEAQAARLSAAIELGVRLATVPEEPTPSFRTPDDVAAYLVPRYASRPVETFGVLALDVRHRLRRESVISVGTLTSSLVHPREVFREAITARAASILVFHNHPSGDPEPSAEDRALTRRLRSAGDVMGIELADHLILGAGRYVSLRARGGF